MSIDVEKWFLHCKANFAEVTPENVGKFANEFKGKNPVVFIHAVEDRTPRL